MIPPLPDSWRTVLGEEIDSPYFQELQRFVADEQAQGPVFPPAEQIFAAMEMTAYEHVRVLILGQDPYPTPGHAHGLAFSVQPGVKPPASLGNIFKELATDLQIPPSKEMGCLSSWARQGVLLLNTVLTVRAGAANSHKGKGWERFTDAVIRRVNERPLPIVFVLWGRPAQQKLKLIDAGRHAIIQSAHPSPLSAHGGFFGSRPFSQVNAALRRLGQPEIDWRVCQAEVLP